MNLSPDTVVQIQQQCMLEARMEYETVIQEANLQLVHTRNIIEQRERDKLELQQLLTTKLHEVCLDMHICTCDP